MAISRGFRTSAESAFVGLHIARQGPRGSTVAVFSQAMPGVGGAIALDEQYRCQLSAQAMVSDSHRTDWAGHARYMLAALDIQKPFSADRFVVKVRQVLEARNTDTLTRTAAEADEAITQPSPRA